MDCPYCNAQLNQTDTYFRGRPGGYVNGSSPHPIGYYSPPTSNYEVLGEIFKCPNYEGFADTGEAEEYKKSTNSEEPVEDISCESSIFSGNYYTDKQENLHEGYPC